MERLWSYFSLLQPVLSSKFSAAITAGTDEDVMARLAELTPATRDIRELSYLLQFIQRASSPIQDKIDWKSSNSPVTVDVTGIISALNALEVSDFGKKNRASSQLPWIQMAIERIARPILQIHRPLPVDLPEKTLAKGCFLFLLTTISGTDIVCPFAIVSSNRKK